MTPEKPTEIAGIYCNRYHENRGYCDVAVVFRHWPQDLREKESEISRTTDKKTYNLLKLIEDVFNEGVDGGDLRTIGTGCIRELPWT